ncbi:MAG: hypothetical protein B7Z66_11095 [Chromatiales bacterium 21-64-14]|nr:MAG: hypothetical protein B7Z66_11095 [Chromatiales bacterium 21-64-14]
MADLRSRRRRLLTALRALWPQVPLAAALAASGLFNVLRGLHHQLPLPSEIQALANVASPLAALGNTTEVILGAGLVLVGIGLLWRLRAAWAFAMLLVAITTGVNAFRAQGTLAVSLPALWLLALTFLRHHFRRHTALGSVLITLISVLSVFAYGSFGSLLLGTGFRPPIRDLTAGFYFTVVTLSTVGYGDIVPVTTEARMFVVSLLVIGLSIFATAVVSTLGPAISGELARIFTPEERKMNLKDHVILLGAGAIARNTARELAARGIRFVQVVTADEEAPLADQPVVKGDASEDPVLQEAGIAHARLVIAAREDDGENAFISLASKDLNPAVQVLAVAGTVRSIRRLKLARADLVFAPAAVGGRLLANLVEGGEIPTQFQDLLEGHPAPKGT